MVIEMANTFSALRVEMRRETKATVGFLRQNVRPYRQKFCRLARKASGLTQEQLCEELNRHPAILKLEKLPSFSRFYPLTPTFIETLENEISKIPEYQPYSQGFFGIGLMGTPTKDIAAVIAEVCGLSSIYRKFEQWSLEYEFGIETVASWGLR